MDLLFAVTRFVFRVRVLGRIETHSISLHTERSGCDRCQGRRIQDLCRMVYQLFAVKRRGLSDLRNDNECADRRKLTCKHAMLLWKNTCSLNMRLPCIRKACSRTSKRLTKSS